jgi:hypothetical protein
MNDRSKKTVGTTAGGVLRHHWTAPDLLSPAEIEELRQYYKKLHADIEEEFARIEREKDSKRRD